jgi:hypothetical protein
MRPQPARGRSKSWQLPVKTSQSETIPERRSLKRKLRFGKPPSQFERLAGVALQCLPGTELVLTLTGSMTSTVKRNRDVRFVTYYSRDAFSATTPPFRRRLLAETRAGRN